MKGLYFLISIILNLLLSVLLIIVNDKLPTAYAQQQQQQQQVENLKYCYKFQWGSEGEKDGQFLRPHDVVFDKEGFIYINDRERNDIQKFSPDGKFIEKLGEKGEKLGEFRSPYSMLIDSNDNLFVIDRGNDRVQKISTNGTPIAAWDSLDGKVITSSKDIKDKEKKDKDKSLLLKRN